MDFSEKLRKITYWFLLRNPDVELWKEIDDYEKYFISSKGRVKSTKFIQPRILKPYKQPLSGHLIVALTKNGIGKTFLVHRLLANAFIPNPGSNPCIDHKDRNPENNSVANLRWCTHGQNMANQSKTKFEKTSKFKGVCFNKGKNKWMSTIHYKQKKLFLGYHDTEAEAAHVYNEIAEILFKEFAALNHIKEKKKEYNKNYNEKRKALIIKAKAMLE